MSTTSVTKVAISTVAIFGCVVVGCGLLSPGPLKAHRGDGAFQDESGRRGLIFVQGYTISMHEFSLDHPYESEYRLAQLPEIKEECGVYLAICHDHGTPFIKDTHEIDGRLEFEMEDSSGNLVTSVAGRLGDYIWAHGGEYELYQMDNSFFFPECEEDYTLRVRYSPDAKLAGMRGFVWLRCGGSL